MRVLAGLMCALALLTVHTPPSAAAAPTLRNALQGLVDGGFPGAIGYVRTGWRAERAAAGLADRETGERATPTHRFRIASNTKAFTSAVLLQLVGEGRLSLDDPVSRWLPGVIAGNGNDGTRITVRQLLNHTAGLYDPTNEKSFWTPYLSGDRDFVYRPRDVVAMAVAHPPTGEPGARHDYSNTNYLVAGLVIEKVTGRSAVSQVYRRILVPLHLVDTRFPTTDPRMYGRHLRGYDLMKEDVTVWSPSYDWTAGAIVSTVDDLAKFYQALFDGTLLKPAQLAELKTTVPTDPDDPMAGYGLGVERRSMPCPDGTVSTVWGNSGGGPGYNSLALSTEDNERQLVLATNTYDITAELDHRPPVPRVDPRPPMNHAFC